MSNPATNKKEKTIECRIRTARPLTIKCPEGAPATLRADDVVRLFTAEAQRDRECLWVLHLNTKHKVVEKELVAMGQLNTCSISIREVFRRAIINSSDGIISIHNHPGGDATPSNDDREMWKCLDEAGNILGIRTLDHIIITPTGEFYSKDGGNMRCRGRSLKTSEIGSTQQSMKESA